MRESILEQQLKSYSALPSSEQTSQAAVQQQTILSQTLEQFNSIYHQSQLELDLSAIEFTRAYPVQVESINGSSYYRIFLDQLPANGNAYTLINDAKQIVAQIIPVTKQANNPACFNILPRAPVIIENSNPDTSLSHAVKVVSHQPVMLGDYINTQLLFIQADDIQCESSVTIKTNEPVILHSFNTCSLKGEIDCDQDVTIKSGHYEGDAFIKADKALIIAATGNQRAKCMLKKTFCSVGPIRFHDTSFVHAPDGVHHITTKIDHHGIVTTNDYSLLHYSGTLNGHYYFPIQSQIVTDHALEAGPAAQFFVNGSMKSHSVLSTLFASELRYYPNLKIVGDDVFIGSDSELPLPELDTEEQKKRGIGFKSGVYLELTGKISIQNASLSASSGGLLKILSEIQLSTNHDACAMHFKANSIAIESNVTTESPLYITETQTVSVSGDAHIKAKQLLIDAPDADIDLGKGTKFTIQQQMLANTAVFKSAANIESQSVTVSAATIRLHNRIKASRQQYAGESIFSTATHIYDDLSSCAFLSTFLGVSLSGRTSHIGLATFSAQLNLQTSFTWPSLQSGALALATLGFGISYFFLPPPIAAGLQIGFTTLLRTNMLAASFSSAFKSFNVALQSPSKVNRVIFTCQLTQSLLISASTITAAVMSIQGLLNSGPLGSPMPFSWTALGKTILPPMLAVTTGSSTYAIVDGSVGGALILSQGGFSVLNLNFSTFAGLSRSQTHILGVDVSANAVGLSSNTIAYGQLIAGDTWSGLGTNTVCASDLTTWMPIAWNYHHWNITADHWHTGSQPSYFDQSSLTASKVHANSLLYINNDSHVAFGDVEDSQGLQITASAGHMNVHVQPNAFLNVSESNVNMQILSNAQGGGVEFMSSTVNVEDMQNNGRLDAELSRVSGSSLANHGHINLTDTYVNMERTSGDLSPTGLSALNSVIATPGSIDTLSELDNMHLNQVIDYCAFHHCYPTADQWFSLLGRKPSQDELQRCNNVMDRHPWVEGQCRALKNQEFDAIFHQQPVTPEGRMLPFLSQQLQEIRQQLLPGVSTVSGLTIRHQAATQTEMAEFRDHQTTVSAEFTPDRIQYQYQSPVTRKNKDTFSGVPEVYVAPSYTLEGLLQSNQTATIVTEHDITLQQARTISQEEIQFYAQGDIHLNNSQLNSQGPVNLHAEGQVQLTGTHVTGSTVSLSGVKGIQSDAQITTSEYHDSHLQIHFLNTSKIHESVVTQTVEPSSLTATATDGDVNVSSAEGPVITHGTFMQAKNDINIHAKKDVLLYDIRGQNIHTIDSTMLLNHTSTTTTQNIATPSLLDQENVHIVSDTGSINGLGAVIRANGEITADAPEEIMFSREILDRTTHVTRTGLLGISTPVLSAADHPVFFGSSLLLSSNPVADLMAVSFTVGREDKTIHTQFLGNGSMQAKNIYLNAKRVAIQNAYGVTADTLHVKAKESFDISGAELHSSLNASQNSLTASLSLVTGNLTSGSYAHADAEMNQTMVVENSPNVRVLDVETQQMHLNAASVHPEVLSGHADTVTISTPLTTSDSVSTAFSLGTDSVFIDIAQGHHRNISASSSLQPADASGFTTNRIDTTDAVVSSNIHANELHEIHQATSDVETSSGVGITVSERGINNLHLQFSDSTQNLVPAFHVDVPVGLITSVVSALMPASTGEVEPAQSDTQTPVINQHEPDHTPRPNPTTPSHTAHNQPTIRDNTVEYLAESMFGDSSDPVSRLFPELLVDATNQPVIEDNTVEYLAESMFGNSSDPVPRLFPELLDNATPTQSIQAQASENMSLHPNLTRLSQHFQIDYTDPYIQAVYRGIFRGISETIVSTYTLVKNGLVLSASYIAHQGRIGNGTECDPTLFDCTAYASASHSKILAGTQSILTHPYQTWQNIKFTFNNMSGPELTEFATSLGTSIFAPVGAINWLSRGNIFARDAGGLMGEFAETPSAEAIYVYRGDHREPSDIFYNGFTAKGSSFSIIQHLSDPLEDTGYIDATSSIDVATTFPHHPETDRTYVYAINIPENGIDVIATLDSIKKYTGEHFEDLVEEEDYRTYLGEKGIMVEQNIMPHDIKGAWTVHITPPDNIGDPLVTNYNYIRSRDDTFIPNPNYRASVPTGLNSDQPSSIFLKNITFFRSMTTVSSATNSIGNSIDQVDNREGMTFFRPAQSIG